MKKNIWKRLLSLALALVLVVGMMPHMATEAHAAGPITLEDDSFTTDPGQGFTFRAYYYCGQCKKYSYPDQPADTNHSIEITSFNYKISQGKISYTYGYKVKGCDGESTGSYSDNNTFDCSQEYNQKGWLHTPSGLSTSHSVAVKFSRSKSAHQGDATCKTAANCTLCGTRYTNANNHEKPNEFTYSVNTSDSTMHDVKYACCGATKETVAHTAEPTYTVNATDHTKHDKTYSCCEGIAETTDHSYTYTADGSVLTEKCSNGCGHQAIASIVAGEAIYTGSEITDAATISYDSGTWAGDKPVLSFENNVNVGTATVKMTAGDATASTTFKINPASLSYATVALDPASGTYTGSVHNRPTYTLTYNGKELDEGTDYIVDGQWTGDFLNAGSHNLVLEGKGNFTGTKTLTYTIGKATPTANLFEMTLPQNPVYDGTTTFPVTVTTTASGMGEFTVKYNGSTGAPVNAGTYTVTVDVAEGTNYSAATVELGTFAVVQARGSASVSVADTEYGDPVTPNPVSSTNGTDHVTYQYKVKGADDSTYTDEEPTAVGSYTVKATFSETTNYTEITATADFEITRRKVTVTADDTSKTYCGTDPELTWTVTSGSELASEPLTGITISRAEGENAGGYPITVSQTEGVNLNYEITFANGTFTINKAPLTVTAENKTVTYGDTVPAYTVTYNGFVGDENEDVLGGTLAFDCDYAQFANKGEYTITPSGLTSGNYEITYKSGTLTVNPKPITVTIADRTSVYGEEIAKLTATDNGIMNNDSNVYSLATEATKTSNVGTYPITGTVLDANYDITFVNGTYTITKATNQWTAAPSITGWTYGETASTPTAVAKCGEVIVTYAEKGTENFTAEVPTQAGDYTAKFTVTGNDNYNGLEETRDFTIAKKALAVTEAVATGREYDGTKTVAITEVTLDGVRAEDTVAVDLTDLTGTLESADKGTYTSVTLPELTLKDDKGNYTLTQPTAAVKTNVEITAKPITVTVADIADQTWTGSALTPAVVSPTGLVKETDEYCTVTYTDNTNVGLATVNMEEKGNYTFTAIEKTFLIVPDESLIAGLTTANVTSADKTDVDKAVAMMNNADLNDAPAEDKADWEALKTLANALQERIEAADAADQTQNIQDAENIGAGNVKLDQKQDLEDALKDLEAAKENYSGNYTREEKAALEADIKRIEDALAAIERVEDFNTAIDDSLLKEDVKTDMDAATEAAIKDAQAAYGELTDYEKTLIDPADKTKLDTLVATITDYKVTKGDGGRYTVGSGKTLSFTANGPVRKFDYVQVNGKTIASSNYTVTEGSTIITLKSSYLDKLGYGKHKIQIFYTDGSTDVANFRIYVNGGNPFTGDNTHMMLFTGIMMTSLLCMVMMVMFVAKKKGKYQR